MAPTLTASAVADQHVGMRQSAPPMLQQQGTKAN